jgi:hypothetical protein
MEKLEIKDDRVCQALNTNVKLPFSHYLSQCTAFLLIFDNHFCFQQKHGYYMYI